MLITIKPNNTNREPIVTSAFADKVEAGVQLVVNTRKRGCYISAYFSQFGGGQRKQVGYHISNGDDLNDDEYDEVVLVAENKRDEKILDGLPYSLTNKDQVEILIVPWAKLKTLRKLCSTFDE